jgi:hypothetical protein
MASKTIPLAVPEKLGKELKRAAAETGLSMADVMRQSMRLGLPLLSRALSREEDFVEAAADTWEKLGPAPTVNYDALDETR